MKLASRVCIFSFVFILPFSGIAQPVFLKKDKESHRNKSWADSVFKTLTPEQRIGQLFMVAAYSNYKSDTATLKKLIDSCGIGGLIFFQGGPKRQAVLTNYYQSLAKIKLLIAIDGEWGLSMRLDSTVLYPRQMTLGAIPSTADSLIYKMGKRVAQECKRMGIHINFAPVLDINNNPSNPVISSRSLGEDKHKVTDKALQYMNGMQDQGVLACGKHFPGHGDTESDSHLTLPLISHSKKTIDTLDLYPFKELFKSGLGSVMVAHLSIPALDESKNMASTLSPKVVNKLLKKDLKYRGLVFTDALNMKGVSKFYKPGEVDVKAILAGNDVLLFSEDVPKAIEEIKKAIERKEIDQEDIDERCLKVLQVKQWCGLNKYSPIDTANLFKDLNTPAANYLNFQLAENAVTVLKNKNSLLPLMNLDTLKIASVVFGAPTHNKFQEMLGYYAPVKTFAFPNDLTQTQSDKLLKQLSEYNLVIIGIAGSVSPNKNFGISSNTLEMIQKINKKTKTIISVFANAYSLKVLNKIIDSTDAIIMAYENKEYMMNVSAQLIFGGISSCGKLPVSAYKNFPVNSGINTAPPIRFKYTVPEEVGISSERLNQIDTLVSRAIAEKVFPGSVVFFAKDRKVFYYKSFGYHTYRNKKPVSKDDVYDLASITKIASTTAATMQLVQQKKIDLDGRLCYYLPELDTTNKANIVIREMLTHQSGLKDWIPFYLQTLNRGEFKSGIFSKYKSQEFPNRVAERLYIDKTYSDTLWKKIIASPMGEKHYRYSDLGLIFMWRIVEKVTQTPINEYMQKNFYSPLGLPTMGFRPRERLPLSRIVPTEYDIKFRKQLLHGDVHDPAAAMFGGVSGHAGLFSDANDLGVMMQMFLQKGEYGGKRYIESSVINEFTKCQFCADNRRAIGFDKPESNPAKDSPICDCVSYLSFGHQGFTGTITWADPETNLVYVFLSNRVYPDADNNKINKIGIRSSLLRVVYGAMK